MGEIFPGTRKILAGRLTPRRIAPQHINSLEDFPRKIPNHVNSALKIPTHSDFWKIAPSPELFPTIYVLIPP